MAKYSAEEYGDLLSRFARGLPGAIGKGRLTAAQQLKRDIPGRIHRVGGTKDIEGSTRSYKSAQYKKRRKGKGLQTTVVDHTFTGDLQRSYKLLQSKSHIDLRIFGNNNVDKARGNEKHYKNDVWEASTSEEKKAIKAFDKVISDYINKFFD